MVGFENNVLRLSLRRSILPRRNTYSNLANSSWSGYVTIRRHLTTRHLLRAFKLGVTGVSLWLARRYRDMRRFGLAARSGCPRLPMICRIHMRVHSTDSRGTSFDQGADQTGGRDVPRGMVRRFLDAAHIARRQTAPIIE